MDTDTKNAIRTGLQFLAFTGREEVLNELGYTVRKTRRNTNLTIKFSKDGEPVATLKTMPDKCALEIYDRIPLEFEVALFEFFTPNEEEVEE